MANLQRKIYIDNFTVSATKIDAYCLIDDQDIDFSLNKEEFETFCDENEMREWESFGYNPLTEDVDDLSGELEWSEIYGSYESMTRFLTAYIQHLYDQDAMDIETPIKAFISSTLKTA